MATISTIGVFAHANAGKTTVTEELLFRAGKVSKVGRVDYGNTTTDNLAVERERGITVRSSYVSFGIKDKIIQLLDTPGHIDFSAEVERAVAILDGAVLVISGVDGVQPQTVAIWKMLSERNVPVVLFINKLDRAGADVERTVDGIRAHLSKNVCLMNSYDKETDRVIPHKADTDDLLDLLSSVDDMVLEKYIGGERIASDFLLSRFQLAAQKGKLFPVFTGSALNGVGIGELMDGIYNWLPEYKNNSNDFSGIVYSSKYDVNKWLTYVKVLSGEMSVGYEMPTDDTDNRLKIKQILKTDGGIMKSVPKATAGELIALPSIYIPVGTMVGKNAGDVVKLSYVNPLFTVGVKSKDMKALSDALAILDKEDPYLNCRYSASTNMFSIDVMGDLQAEIVATLLKNRFDLDGVVLSDSSIIYKETPVGIGLGKAGYKKCSNVGISVRPLNKGEGIKFVSNFSTDFLFAKYQKQVERLLVQRYSKSGLRGWELTDAEIAIIDGKCDNAGSEPLHYNIAAPIAFMRALQNAGTKMLEPLMEFELSCSADKLSVAMAELTKNYNTSIETSVSGANLYVKGTAPLSVSKNFPRIFARVLGGAFSFVQREAGYIDALPDVQCTRDAGFISPLNVEKFVSSMNGNMILLDKGLGERGGKPKFPRRNNFIKKREALARKKKQIIGEKTR